MIKAYKFDKNILLKIIVWALIPSLLIQPISICFAQTQNVCEERLKDAEKKFYDGFFDEAIDLLNQCLAEKDISTQERAKAHELLAKTYLGKDYIDQAKGAIQKLLELVPTYSANPERDTPTFVDLVQQVKSEKGEEKKEEGKPWYKNTWVWIGAGVVVVGIVLIAVLAGGKEEEKPVPETPLPDPPVLP
ncbi:MAG: hypothetical protein QME52_05615 [Bacteroidota bacterium]|nr:hypothetical protein [Bacteroidota bacterium]